MHGCMHEWKHGWMHARMPVCMDECIHVLMDACAYALMDSWVYAIIVYMQKIQCKISILVVRWALFRPAQPILEAGFLFPFCRLATQPPPEPHLL